MSALTLSPDVRVDPPAILPVEHLSLSSLKLFMQCPERWRRRYLDHEPEPTAGKLVLGGAAHAALAQHYGLQIENGEGYSVEQLLDEFSAEWELRISREEVDYEGDSPGALKDSGAAGLRIYRAVIAPEVTPVDVEREFEFSWPGVAWRLTGYIDLEDSDGGVRDSKMVARRMSQKDADADLQVDVLLTARRAEGNPASGFAFDTIVRNKQPLVDVVRTERSDAQLDFLTERIFRLAIEIRWRCESGIWSGAAPGTWFCGTCRYGDCPLRLGARS